MEPIRAQEEPPPDLGRGNPLNSEIEFSMLPRQFRVDRNSSLGEHDSALIRSRFAEPNVFDDLKAARFSP
jgi:hypothetical protein